MRLSPGHGRNVEDRRGMGMGGGLGIGGGLLGLILALIFGGDIFGGGGGGGAVVNQPTQTTANGTVAESAEEAQLRRTVTDVLDDAQTVWAQTLPKYGQNYQDARLVLFRNAVQSGCGNAQSAMGPFYCPLDQRVYIDLGFYDELRRRFGADGDFAQAYVITHEIGHHLQTVLGTSQRVRELQERRPDQANQLSVRLELQADCYAGVWGHSLKQRGQLDPGDVEEGLNAAAAIGDDRIQEMSGRGIRPESFTHGSSAQRVQWFRRGMESGDPRNCDTFAGAI
jgi:uncharacterized protein